MRLHARNLTAHVDTDPNAHRSVQLRFAGLRIAMTPAEARALADSLHDLTDTLEENHP